MTIARSPEKQLKVKQFPEFAVLGARPPYWINKGLWDVWDNTLHLRRGSLGLAYFTRRFSMALFEINIRRPQRALYYFLAKIIHI